MQTGELIRKLRKEKGLTQEQLGELLGVQKSAVAKYESGRVENLKRTTMSKLAEIFDVPAQIFVDVPDKSSKWDCLINYPIYSCLSCGKGTWIEDDQCDTVGIPQYMSFKGEGFANPAEGNSMEPGIHEGDLLIFQRSEEVESGSIGAFSLNGAYYCKRFKRLPDGSCWLFSDNDMYEPIPIIPGDDFRTLGKYKLKLSKEQ